MDLIFIINLFFYNLSLFLNSIIYLESKLFFFFYFLINFDIYLIP